MIRISKLTDYGVLVATLLVDRDGALSARELAAEAALPEPTVGKVLRALTRAGVLVSQRGAAGGYRLAHAPEAISVAEIIEALEGPISLTECLGEAPHPCDVESCCPTRTNWERINGAIRRALEEIPLSEMARPQRGWRQRMGHAILDLTAHAKEAR